MSKSTSFQQDQASGVGAQLLGEIVSVEDGMVIGWAQNEAYLQSLVCLDLLIEGQVIDTILTNRSERGVSEGHAFTIVPPSLLEGSIEIRRSLDQASLPYRISRGGLIRYP